MIRSNVWEYNIKTVDFWLMDDDALQKKGKSIIKNNHNKNSSTDIIHTSFMY